MSATFDADAGARAEPASVVVLARAPRSGECKRRLQGMLGSAGCARLQALLIARAAAWAASVAPGRAHMAVSPPDAVEEVAALIGDQLAVFAQDGDSRDGGMAAVAARLLSAWPGPLLIAGTDAPTLSERHAQAAIEDLREGCDLSVGPTSDGGWYLLGTTRASLDAVHQAQPQSTTGMLGHWLAAAGAGRISVGLLSAERPLHTEQDARALLADPLTSADLRHALGATAPMRDPVT